MQLKDIDFKLVGGILLMIAIITYVVAGDNETLTFVVSIIVMLGLVLCIVGLVETMIKSKKENELLEKDIDRIIQPLVTKYSTYNKELIKNLTEENYPEYVEERKKINKEMEKELTEQIPYLTSKEIKLIVIEFNRNQDELLKNNDNQ